MTRRLCLAAVLLALALPHVLTAQGDVEENGSGPGETFEAFLDGIRTEARSRGITDATLDRALTGLTPEPVVVSRDRSQPETTQSLDEYVRRRLTSRVVASGRRALQSQRTLLARIERTYGVPPSLMVAIWGLESNFGAFTGTYSTIRSLATLAFDARRPLFREELFHALTILDRRGVPPDELKGSWAGAMGQPQFMPSSYLQYAVDDDGDGHANIWTSRPDVFASMANYLEAHGWRQGERWGREVVVSRAVMARIDRQIPMRTAGCRAVRELTVRRPLAEWQTLGVRLTGNRRLPISDMTASLVRGRQRHFLVYANFEALLEYNCSNAYAIAVGLLSDQL